MNTMLQELHNLGLVPVVKIDDAEKAVPLAQALIDGGLPCAEVTFRTDDAKESIRRMVEAYPQMIVGAGTVLTPAQVDDALEAGAKFIVSPGFNADVVDYCLKRDVLVIPGIDSPAGVEQCLARGLTTVKFFPAENSGGIKYINALAGPYGSVTFMPTGGINPDNLTDYTTNPHVLACGGTWMVKGDLIENDRFDEITRLCQEATSRMLGFRLAHIGINAPNADEAERTAKLICSLFGFDLRDGDSYFCSPYVEVLKAPYLGTHGHIAIATIDIDRAVASFMRRGIAFDPDSAKYLPDGRLNAIYLADEVAGFAVHLVRG